MDLFGPLYKVISRTNSKQRFITGFIQNEPTDDVWSIHACHPTLIPNVVEKYYINTDFVIVKLNPEQITDEEFSLVQTEWEDGTVHQCILRSEGKLLSAKCIFD